MGTVHGVYLKYVGLSALSYAGYSYVIASGESHETVHLVLGLRSLMNRADGHGIHVSWFRLCVASLLKYSSIINGSIAVLFKLRRGMLLLGKDPTTGQLPRWSYVLFFPFHLPNILYTFAHTKFGTRKGSVPVASEIIPGWWVGGCYSNELGKKWGGVIDLTVEFPEKCIESTDEYLLIPSWDGVPATPAELEKAAVFAVQARKKGDVLIHCAHGRGRSTTVMCAALVKAGFFNTWEEAFEKGIKPKRSVCKLNSSMKKALAVWQKNFVDEKKIL
jgi:protein-tyrosine phosphatase